MPELPEVETIARGLARRITGDTIESVWLGEKPEPLKSPARDIAKTIENARISGIRRMGKHIVFDLEPNAGTLGFLAKKKGASGGKKPQSPAGRAERHHRLSRGRSEGVSAVEARKSQFIVHLGMTGRLQVCDPRAEIAKHTHAIAKLASGAELRFVDPRRFGRLSVANKTNFETVGVEPLEIDLDSFIALFRGRKTPMKSALLNQKLLRGVGNIYADESLFRAGIRPRRRASTIKHDEFARLYAALKEVLKEAIELGGSSISDYVDSNGEEGFFQLQHRVYGREDESCLVCKSRIKRVILGGRSSHYCPRCQR